MNQIAVLIPTYKRPHKLENLLNNFAKYSKKAKLYFVVSPADIDTLQEINQLWDNYEFELLECGGEYRECINYGYLMTKEPFIFCGADDILFTQDWDIKLLKVMEDEKIGVTGGIDDWLCSKSGVHISHPLVRREYIRNYGGCFNRKNVIYNPLMSHYQIDIELEQLAWTRGMIRVCQDCVIHHNHFVNHKVEEDETYRKSKKSFDKDMEEYNKIKKNFEYWDLRELYQGRAEPSEHNRKKLSIILPIYNAKKFTDMTMASLLEKTRHKYELILIDDKSDEFGGYQYTRKLKDQAIEAGFTQVEIVLNKKQMFTNYNWNVGVKMATGDYIAVINNDIEFLEDEWDDYLIENLELGYEIANPFQVDDVYKKAYMKPPKEDVLYFLNIRGACYMMRRDFALKAFPIPEGLTHWFGDNYISQQLSNYIYDIRVTIRHHISQSGRTVNQDTFWRMVYKDGLNYQKLYPNDDVSVIINNIKKRLKL